MSEQVKVILTQEDIEVIRSALAYKADAYRVWCGETSLGMVQKRAHWAEADACSNLSAFLANV